MKNRPARQYGIDPSGGAQIAGGDQWFCPTCGDSPPNLPADGRFSRAHPACIPVTDPSTGRTALLCSRCYFRTLSNLVPSLVILEEDGSFKPHYQITDEMLVRMGLKAPEEVDGAQPAETEQPAETAENSEDAAEPTPSEESGLVLARS